MTWIEKAVDWLKRAVKAVKDYIRVDGLKHIAVCFFLSCVLIPLMPWYWSLAVVSVVIFGKEARDFITKAGTPEWHDIICGYMGVAMAVLLFLYYWLLLFIRV